MKTKNLSNLRGKVNNANSLKVELVRAINHSMVYAKRSAGYSLNAAALLTVLKEAVVEARKWTQASSIDATPATVTLAAAATQQITTNATYADGTVVNVSTDYRVTYATSDATKATVSASGLITAVATGSATITVTFNGRTDTVVVTIS